MANSESPAVSSNGVSYSETGLPPMSCYISKFAKRLLVLTLTISRESHRKHVRPDGWQSNMSRLTTNMPSLQRIACERGRPPEHVNCVVWIRHAHTTCNWTVRQCGG